MPVRKVTKEEIVIKSIGLFNTRGYWGVSMKDISDACGLVKASLYHHFQSKAHLAIACVNAAVEQFDSLDKGCFHCFNSFKFLLMFDNELNDCAETREIYLTMLDSGDKIRNFILQLLEAHYLLRIKRINHVEKY